MLYALIGEDAPGTLEKRLAVRARHLDRIKALAADGRVAIAGPFPAIDAADPGPAGFTGSLIVAEFASRAEAESWLAADPYVTEGVFARTTVRPFRQVLP